MLPAVSLSKVFRGSAALLFATAVLPVLAQTCTTTITGKVYSPLGPTAGDPIPNILVYVATTPVQALPQGLTSCAGESQLVTGNPLVSTLGSGSGTTTATHAGTWQTDNAAAPPNDVAHTVEVGLGTLYGVTNADGTPDTSQVIELDMSVDSAMKMIVTLGVVVPPPVVPHAVVPPVVVPAGPAP